MNLQFIVQNNPKREIIQAFFENVFKEIPDGIEFTDDQDQALHEWFSVDQMLLYLQHGQLIEAHDKDRLVGAIFIAKQNPISWPDGHKMEVFILGVHQEYRGQGIAKELLKRAESYASQSGAKKIVINTHILQEQVQQMYESLGYRRMGILTDYYDNGDAVFFSKEL